jgi:outer membrane protein assembly factor BamE
MRTKLILLSFLLVSCSDFSMPSIPSVPSIPLPTAYKMDIHQGNYITPEMLEKLKLGMHKSQVRYVLGTPMVSDVFHGNRWDYVYRLERHNKIVEEQHLTLYFDGDNLVKIDQMVKIDPEADVLKSVQGWAAAWAAKNTQDYLAAYATDFKPSDMSRDVWEKQRIDLINRPKIIEVVLSDINISIQDDSHATASFTQNYRSDGYRDHVEKTLYLVKQSDHWLITEERVGKVVKDKAKDQTDESADANTQPLDANQQAVHDAIKRWADAWSARDANKYFASYSTAFKPKGTGATALEAQRKELIGNANFIAVKIRELKIKLPDESHASATFIQDYRSDSHNSSTRKTLLLEKIGGSWLIVDEQAAK